MDKLNRIADLKRILAERRTPIAISAIQHRLECSESTARRLLHSYRDEFGAPLVYDPKRRGWHLDQKADGAADELPGLWFKPAELHALLATRELLRQLEPGLLAEQTAPIAARVEGILAHQGVAADEIARRVRLIAIGARNTPSDGFTAVAEAVLSRQRLRIHYEPRGREPEPTRPRDVSPQRLSWYRGNWYLEAWCHRAEALRCFSIDRIAHPEILDNPAKEIPGSDLDDYFTTAFGIFAGPPDAVAVLRFSSRRARWVAEEVWHPDQQHKWLPDGRYQLALPYSKAHPHELLMDILKYGADCEILSPPALRSAAVEQLRGALAMYSNDGTAGSGNEPGR